eukprot:TRINITY_DN48033_c0_g1_i1.p1 TRINITY_DN48033_c0_g1~~TRINITY_DN48033_c0_g1_i1.p1  ORF type:complete len:688 (+),score=108.86 TRINITY_DN48033_c0_g1_i1:41-2104(+)
MGTLEIPLPDDCGNVDWRSLMQDLRVLGEKIQATATVQRAKSCVSVRGDRRGLSSAVVEVGKVLGHHFPSEDWAFLADLEPDEDQVGVHMAGPRLAEIPAPSFSPAKPPQEANREPNVRCEVFAKDGQEGLSRCIWQSGTRSSKKFDWSRCGQRGQSNGQPSSRDSDNVNGEQSSRAFGSNLGRRTQSEGFPGNGSRKQQASGFPHSGKGYGKTAVSRHQVVSADLGEVFHIDGSVLEGGGQILRMSCAYAALLSSSIHVFNIRANRSKPGLAAQHLASLRLVRDITNANLTGDQLGSTEVTLEPDALGRGSFFADPGTAGSITLMMQASLVPLAFAGAPCTLELLGGTDVNGGPPLDFTRHVLRPFLQHMGMSFDVRCERRGFYPEGGGKVLLYMDPLQGPLEPIILDHQGKPLAVRVTCHTTRTVSQEEQEAVEAASWEHLRRLAPELRFSFDTAAPGISSESRYIRYWVDLVLETTSGALFHASSEHGSLSRHAWLAEPVARAVCSAEAILQQQLSSGSAIDEHLLDQLILPISLARGRSRLLTSEPSLHTWTAIHIAEQLLPQVSFSHRSMGDLYMIEVDGIAFQPPARRPSPENSLLRTFTVPAPTMEDRVQLPYGMLCQAPPQLLRDLKSDLLQLSAGIGAEVFAETAQDCMLVRGSPQQRAAALDELSKITHFYFDWTPD